MRHGKKRLQLNRFTSWRKATLISLAKNLLLRQSIKTTRTRAFAVKPLVEKLISLAKDNSLNAKRAAYKVIGDHNLVSRLFNDIGPRFKHRNGGYTRILNLGFRRGDGAKLVVFELSEIIKREIKKSQKLQKEVEKPIQAETVSEVKPQIETAVKEEKHPELKKPAKRFLGGIRKIFKKERDSL